MSEKDCPSNDDEPETYKTLREAQEALAAKLGYRHWSGDLLRILPLRTASGPAGREKSQARGRLALWQLHGSLERTPMNAILMLTRNALELTKQAVASVFDQNIPVTLYIVENDSSDGTKEWLKEHSFKLRYWNMTPAKGVSASWNFGLNYLFETAGCEYVLVINNDVVLPGTFYSELLRDGGDFVTGVGVNDLAQLDQPFQPLRRPKPDFSGFLIRRKVWSVVGDFDENIVLYCGDCDYHLRCEKAGVQCYTIGIPFYHVASGTLKYASEEERRAIQEQANRDRDFFLRKWGFEVGSVSYNQQFAGNTSNVAQ